MLCIWRFADCLGLVEREALPYEAAMKYKECIAEQNKEPEVVEEEPKEEQKKEFYFFTFKVAGVTFKNGRKTRQAILRSFKYGDEEMETVDLEQYIYEGRDAVYVKINDQIVGNIPSDRVAEFMDLRSKYPYEVTICDIYGGHKLDDGSRANFGCEVVVRFKLI